MTNVKEHWSDRFTDQIKDLEAQVDEMAKLLLAEGYIFNTCTMGRKCEDHKTHWSKSPAPEVTND